MSPGILPGHFQLIEMNLHGWTSRLCCPDFANPFAQGSVQTFDFLNGMAITLGDNFIRHVPVSPLGFSDDQRDLFPIDQLPGNSVLSLEFLHISELRIGRRPSSS